MESPLPEADVWSPALVEKRITFTRMKTSYYLGITLLAGVLGLASCYDIGPQKADDQAKLNTVPVSIGGEVVFRERDGGFFGILADNGRQYEPANLDPAFHTEGLRVTLSGQLDTTKLGKHQWGNPIELEKVKAQM